MYGTVEDWRTYATARGNSAPAAASDELASAALTRASDYIKYRYVANLLPSYDDTLPVVGEATYVAASLELANPGFFSKTFTQAEHKVLTEVKGIKWTVVGNASTVASMSPTSTLIDAMFEKYVTDDLPPFFMLKSVGG